MAFKVYNVTIAQTATAQALTTAPTGSSLGVAVQEIGFDPAIAHDTYIGDSSVSSTNYAIKLAANGTQPRTVGNGPGAIKIDSLDHFYVSGTANDVLHFYVVTL
ncbi:MAG TPA: hypothetical protein VIX18_09295 [Nitrospirota bacterium]